MAGQRIGLPANGTELPGYFSPSAGGKGPGVIVLHEWWGLVPHIEQICDRFAGEGFSALAPDLYRGKSATAPDEAGHLMMHLNIDEARKDLRALIVYLARHPAVSSKKIGCVGFSMGGQLALLAATESSEIGACVDYYGIHPNVTPDFTRLNAPVFGFFGQEDTAVSPDWVRRLGQTLHDLNKDVDFTIYPGAYHSFFNDTHPDVYNAQLAQATWNKMADFFREKLA